MTVAAKTAGTEPIAGIRARPEAFSGGGPPFEIHTDAARGTAHKAHAGARTDAKCFDARIVATACCDGQSRISAGSSDRKAGPVTPTKRTETMTAARATTEFATMTGSTANAQETQTARVPLKIHTLSTGSCAGCCRETMTCCASCATHGSEACTIPRTCRQETETARGTTTE